MRKKRLVSIALSMVMALSVLTGYVPANNVMAMDVVTEEGTEAIVDVSSKESTEESTEVNLDEVVTEDVVVLSFDTTEAEQNPEEPVAIVEEVGECVAAAGEAKGEYVDFAPYLKSHYTYVDGSAVLSGSTIDMYKDFSISLSFALKMSDMDAQIDESKGITGLKYYFTIPEHMNIGDIGTESDPKILYNAKKKEIGTYFVKDSVLYVTFPGYYDMVTANFSMGGSWSDVGGSSKLEIKWPDDTEVFWVDRCGVQASKSGRSFVEQKDGSLLSTYRVRISPKKNNSDINNMTIVDIYKSASEDDIIKDYFGAGNDIKLTYSNSDSTVDKTEYYKAGDVLTENPGGFYFYVSGISLKAGQYLTLEYATKVNKDVVDTWNSSQKIVNMSNEVRVSYPLYDSLTGQNEMVYTDTSISDTFTGKPKFIIKEAGDESIVKNQNDEEKRLVPYILSINKDRYYDLSGCATTDTITVFKQDSGDADGDVVYDINNPAETYLLRTNENVAEEKVMQKWVVLSDEQFAAIKAIAESTSAGRATQKLRNNEAALKTVLDAINVLEGTSYEEFTDELALKYIFTSPEAHDFVWFSPYDNIITTYTLHYMTIGDVAVGEFSNGCNLWYTEKEGAPDPGVDGEDMKKLMYASKYNKGVYVGADGNYYVDYVITVGVKANSLGFDDVFLLELFPCISNTRNKYDHLVGIDSLPLDDLDTAYDNLQKVFKFSTTSNDPRVKAVVEGCKVDLVRSGTYAADASIDYNWNHKFNLSELKASADFSTEGQFCDEDSSSSDKYYTLSKAFFYIGDLPSTTEGYEIQIDYTMQICPENVEALKTENFECKAKNYVDVKTRYNSSNGWIYETERGGELGYMNSLNSEYWLEYLKGSPIIDKNVSSYDEVDKTLSYTVDINKEKTEFESKSSYIISDEINQMDVEYDLDTILLKDEEDRIIYSANSTIIDSKYLGLTTFDLEKGKGSNGFSIVLNNKNQDFDENNTMISMKLEYKVKVDEEKIAKNIEIVNVVTLSSVSLTEDGKSSKTTILDTDSAVATLDDALSKQTVVGKSPSYSNNYVGTFEIMVNPQSSNAKELREYSVGDTFTVIDTPNKYLEIDPTTIKVYEIVNGTSTDISDDVEIEYGKVGNLSARLEAAITIRNIDAKYRIVYNAKVNNYGLETVHVLNKAQILSTSIEPVDWEDDIFIVKEASDSEAYTCKIKLKKYDRNKPSKGVQATFRLEKYNPSTREYTVLSEDIKTNENGEVIIQNKIVNKVPIEYVELNTIYRLTELATEDGYVLNSNPIYYYVCDDAKNNPYSYMSVVVPEGGATEDEYPVISVSNSTFGFYINKVFSTYLTEPQEPVYSEFTLYRDEACTDEVMVGKDALGDCMIAFKNITPKDGEDLFNSTFYIKETKFPDRAKQVETVYKVVFKDGLISGLYVDGKSMPSYLSYSYAASYTNGYDIPTICISNTPDYGQLWLYKNVVSDVTTDKYEKYTFKITLKDADGNELDGEYPAFIYNDKTKKKTLTIKSGDTFSFKAIEPSNNTRNMFYIDCLPSGTTYEIEELDKGFKTSYVVFDNNGSDDVSRAKAGKVVTGKIDENGYDQVTYTNESRIGVEIHKECVDSAGNTYDFPDGLTFGIAFSEGGDSQIKVVYDKANDEFKLTETNYANKDTAYVKRLDDGAIYIGGIDKGTATNIYVVEESAEQKDTEWTAYVIDSYGKYSLGTRHTLYSPKNGSTYMAFYRNQLIEKKVEAKIQFKKVLVGRDLKEGEFTFYLEEDTGAGYRQVASATNDADGNVTFDVEIDSNLMQTDSHKKYRCYENKMSGYTPYSYNKNGSSVPIYDGIWYKSYYHLTEPKNSQNYNYVDISIKKNDDGDYEPVYKYDSGSTLPRQAGVGVYTEDGVSYFENEYIITSTSVSIPFSKLLLGKTISGGSDKFTFTLSQTEEDFETPVTKDGTPVTYTFNNKMYYNTLDKRVFGRFNISFDESDIGKTFYYVLTEDIPADTDKLPGITYDESKYMYKVKVIDSGKGSLTADITVTDEKGRVIMKRATPYNEVTGEDMPENNYAYDPDTGFVYEGDSILTYPLAFTNVYESSAEFTLEGTKFVDNADCKVGDYKFEIVEYTDETRTEVKKKDGEEIIYTATTKADATMDRATQKSNAEIDFPTITVTHGQGEFKHYYKVREVIPKDAVDNKKDGITYTTKEYDVTVTFTDKADEFNTPTIEVDAPTIEFENKYGATGSIELGVTKKAEDKNGDDYADKDDDAVANNSKFDFSIYEVTSIPADKEEMVDEADRTFIEKITVSVGETKKFEAFEYGLSDVGSKYYMIVEEDSDEKGYTCKNKIQYVEVSIVNQNDGTLKATVVDGTYDVSFVNVYDAEGKITLEGTKTLEHLADMIKNNKLYDGEFTFTVTEKVDGADVTVATGVSKADGKIEFTEIEYTWDDRGTHTYVITEDEVVNPQTADEEGPKNIMFDVNSVTATVVVKNDGEGRLEASVTYEKAGKPVDEAKFINTTTDTKVFKVDEAGNAVSGARLGIYDENDAEIYTFISGDEAVVIYGLDKDKTYTLKEIETPKGYKDADPIKFKVEADGKLTIDGETVEEIKMVDVSIKATTIEFEGTKILEHLSDMVLNNEFYEGEFTFTVTEDVEGKAVKVATGAIDADGNIKFTEIPYTWESIGTHVYTITEDAKVNATEDGKAIDNVLFDKGTVTVTVDVANDGEDNLVTTVSYAKDGEKVDSIEFTNKSTKTKVLKVDEDGNPLSGAKLGIYDKDGNEIYTFTTGTDIETIYGLEKNVTYSIREIVTPKGYKIADPIEFMVNDNGEMVVNGETVEVIEMVDQLVKIDDDEHNSKTGDNARIPLAMMLLFMSLCAVSVLGIMKRKNK